MFVGNLPKSTTKQQLLKLFSPYGKVKSVRLRSSIGDKLLTSYDRKKAVRLNGYVVFAEQSDAENALSLNGHEFKENIIRVNLAKTKSNESGNRTVFVGNLKFSKI